MTQALLLVDVQCGFLPLVAGGEDLSERLAAVAARARAVGAPVILLQQDGPEASPFAPGMPGWEVDPRVRDAKDVVIRKTATDGFFRTSLADVLNKAGVRTVVLGGLATEHCVDATVRSALSHGFNVQLLADGHTTADGGTLSCEQVVAHHNAALVLGAHPGGTVELIDTAVAFN